MNPVNAEIGLTMNFAAVILEARLFLGASQLDLEQDLEAGFAVHKCLRRGSWKVR